MRFNQQKVTLYKKYSSVNIFIYESSFCVVHYGALIATELKSTHGISELLEDKTYMWMYVVNMSETCKRIQ